MKYEVDIDVQVSCSECQRALTVVETGDSLYVNPCEYCMENARQDGNSQGYREGYDDGNRAAGEASP